MRVGGKVYLKKIKKLIVKTKIPVIQCTTSLGKKDTVYLFNASLNF